MKIEDIAKIVHEANKAYCESIGDFSQAPWNLAEPWQKASAVAGVQHLINNPEASPSDSHESWLQMKIAEGWQYGKIKNAKIKRHPCMVPYNELPEEQKLKDLIFSNLVKTLIPYISDNIDVSKNSTEKTSEVNSADEEALAMESNPEKETKKKASFISKLTAKLKDTSK